MKYPHIQQHDEKDCGAACLAMISAYYGLKLPIAKFRTLIKVDQQGANIYGLVTGAEQIGFTADALEGDFEELVDGIHQKEIELPAIARIINEYGFEHYVVIFEMKEDTVTLGDPARTKISQLPIALFKEQWQGQIVTFQPTQQFKQRNEVKGLFLRFFKYILNQKKILSIIFIFSIIISGINMFGTVIFQYVLNDATSISGEVAEDVEEEEHDSHEKDSFYEKAMEKIEVVFDNLNVVCITIIGLYLLKCFIQILRSYMLAMTSKNINVPLLTDFYNHMIGLPSEFFGTRKSGELISRFQNASEIKEAISSATLTLMLDSLMAIVFGVVLFLINKTLFFITIITVLIYAIVMFFFKSPIRFVNHEIMEKDAQVTSYLKETVDGVDVIRASNSGQLVKSRLKELVTDRENKFVKGTMIGSVQVAIVELISAVSIVVLLWAGAYLCVENVITLGALFTFYYMIDYFLNPISNLIDLQPTLQTASVAAERLNDVFDSEMEDVGQISDLNVTDIQVKNLRFRYGNREEVLKGIHMHIQKGQKIAIVGESGCGKTTLAKLLLRFYEPESGNIYINGQNITNYSRLSIRNRIAYIPQNVFLFSDTIKNNLKMVDEHVTDEEIERVCKLCKADAFIQNLPLKYDTILEENGSNLSGGQRQRLAIARALLSKPDVLIMDEATSNLDTITEKAIYEVLHTVLKDTTCIMIAHRLRTIKNCDYIYIIKDGSIVEEGTHNMLMSNNGLYSSYYNS